MKPYKGFFLRGKKGQAKDNKSYMEGTMENVQLTNHETKTVTSALMLACSKCSVTNYNKCCFRELYKRLTDKELCWKERSTY